MADPKIQAAKDQITTGALKYIFLSMNSSFPLMFSVPYSMSPPDWKRSSQYQYSSVFKLSNLELKESPILSVFA